MLATSKQSFVDQRYVAMIYVGLGETDQALDWLEEAYEKRNSGWLPFMGVEPEFLSLHGHPRFEALLKKMGVSPTRPAPPLGVCPQARTLTQAEGRKGVKGRKGVTRTSDTTTKPAPATPK
jgi:hypothetical protein